MCALGAGPVNEPDGPSAAICDGRSDSGFMGDGVARGSASARSRAGSSSAVATPDAAPAGGRGTAGSCCGSGVAAREAAPGIPDGDCESRAVPGSTFPPSALIPDGLEPDPRDSCRSNAPRFWRERPDVEPATCSIASESPRARAVETPTTRSIAAPLPAHRWVQRARRTRRLTESERLEASSSFARVRRTFRWPSQPSFGSAPALSIQT